MSSNSEDWSDDAAAAAPPLTAEQRVGLAELLAEAREYLVHKATLIEGKSA